MHRPRDSGGSSTDRHYSTIHSVTQSYVTKAFHLQAHCGNPAILIAAARYPLQPFTLWGVLDRPCAPAFSIATHRPTPPPRPRPPPRVPPLQTPGAPNIPRITYSALIRFCPVLAARSTPRFRRPPPSLPLPPCLPRRLCKLVAQAAGSKHSCARRAQPPKERLKRVRGYKRCFLNTPFVRRY